MKINDIESTTHVTIITKHDDDEGKWKSLCCVLVIIIGLIIRTTDRLLNTEYV
jgi:hypothetical protein